MSPIARRGILQVTNTHLLVEFVTATVFPGPPAEAPISGDSGPAIPLAAIVGGVVAGMLLVITVTAGWFYWEKSTQCKTVKERKEAEAKRSNTLHNATVSGPRIYQPFFSRPTEKLIRFVGGDNGQRDDSREVVPLPSFVDKKQVASSPTPSATAPRRSRPKLLRLIKGSPRLSPLVEPKKDLPPIHPGSQSFAAGIPHRPSSISSASAYSTTSGEEHEIWGLSGAILAALNLGSLNSSTDPAHRNSLGQSDQRSPSSGRGYLSPADQGVQGGPQWNRHSQASSSVSGDCPSVDESGAPIGVAY